MGRILYYFPTPASETADCVPFIEEAGLEGVLPKGIRSTRVCREGPDGGPGLLVARTAAGYYPDRQRWSQPAQEDAAWWLGIEGDVTPADVARDPQIPGVELRLRDGHPWMIPLAVLEGSSDHLPSIEEEDSGGDPVSVPDPRWDVLREDAARVLELAEAMNEDSDVDAGTVTYRDLWRIAIRALGTNYYLGGPEVSALKLLSRELVGYVATALVDTFAVTAQELSRDGRRAALAPLMATVDDDQERDEDEGSAAS